MIDSKWPAACDIAVVAVLGVLLASGSVVAQGQADCPAAVEAWMNSPRHRANILSAKFRRYGAGVQGRYYVVNVTD